MNRTVLLIKPSQKKKLVSIAERECVSVAEVNRRAIDQYVHSSTEEMKVLDLLTKALIESNKRAEKALKMAEKTIDDLLNTGKK